MFYIPYKKRISNGNVKMYTSEHWTRWRSRHELMTSQYRRRYSRSWWRHRRRSRRPRRGRGRGRRRGWAARRMRSRRRRRTCVPRWTTRHRQPGPLGHRLRRLPTRPVADASRSPSDDRPTVRSLLLTSRTDHIASGHSWSETFATQSTRMIHDTSELKMGQMFWPTTTTQSTGGCYAPISVSKRSKTRLDSKIRKLKI